MNYKFTFLQGCERDIDKATKRNPLLKKILEKKINQILPDPHHYKPLRNVLVGERRVHIMNSLVLKFIIDEQNRKVIFIFFGHHDKAY